MTTPRTTETGSAGQQTVLLVEDDSFLSGMYISKFTMENYQVTLAADGLEAVASIRKSPPNIILLDINLPKLDGFGVLEEIKKEPQLAKIPVVMLTNYSDEKYQQRAKEFGVAEYIIKSQYRPGEVVDRVKQILLRAQT